LNLGWLIERFESAPEKVAFFDQNSPVTYLDLCKMVTDFDTMIANLGILAGENVAVVGDYSPESFALLLSLARNRNIAIPLSQDSTVEIDSALKISGCNWRFEFDKKTNQPVATRHFIECESELLTEFRLTKEPGLILFSSGSSGEPKAILHNVNKVALKFVEPRDPVVAVPFLMFDHFGGFNTILAITSSLGTVVTVPDRSVKNICSAIARYNVTLLPTTPSFLNLLLATRAHDDHDLTSLQRITYGTEVMPQSTLERLRGVFPHVKLQQTYGLSELGVLSSNSREDGSLWMRLGGTGFETKVVEGVLWIKSQFAMVGYLNSPHAFDDLGWFNTQDQVEVDGEYFRILGRTTDLINVGGQKVYPAEIEEVILRLPNVVDVVVFGEASALLGQMVVARIVLQDPEEETAVKTRVRLACREVLAAYKVPSKVLITENSLYSARHKKSRFSPPGSVNN
jgi:acyl-CoA synthetase (AMP-forming)/AMP-acid ligase II